MGLESASTIYDLNAANPPGTDGRPEGDNHIRLVKGAIQGTFLKGTEAALPAAGTVGRRYIATDTKKYYYDTGAAWVEIGSAQITGSVETGDIVLTAADYGKTIFVDASVAQRTVTLPSVAGLIVGWYVNVVRQTGTNKILVKDSGGSTVRTMYRTDWKTTVATDKVSWFSDIYIGGIGFSVLKSTSQTGFSTGVWGKVTWQTETYDDSAVFASSSFTAPRPGVYAFYACLHLGDPPNDGQGVSVGIFIDSSPFAVVSFVGGTTDQYNPLRITVMPKLAESAVVDVYYKKDQSACDTISSDVLLTWFTGNFLREG